MKKRKVIFVSWQPYCSRSDNIARQFDGKSFKIYYDVFGSNYYTILFKYIIQSIHTLIILFREKPEIVFVMNPPVFACLPVYLFCKIFNKKYIIDAHTGAFSDSMWKKVKFLQRYFSKCAITTIVTNNDIAFELIDWKCDYTIVPDVPIIYNNPNFNSINKSDTIVTLVNTFAKDEPLENFLEAVSLIRNVNFYISGKIPKNFSLTKYTKQKNIHFTDFLPNQEYYGLLLHSDLIVVLTTRDKTMQRGAYEAIYLGKPVVTSNWKILRTNFAKGAIFVDNSSEGILSGIKQALDSVDKLTAEAMLLREEKMENWKANQEILTSKMS